MRAYVLINASAGKAIEVARSLQGVKGIELADAMVPLIEDTPLRRRQIEAFARLDAIMRTGSSMPAARAAETVLQLLRREQSA